MRRPPRRCLLCSVFPAPAGGPVAALRDDTKVLLGPAALLFSTLLTQSAGW